MASFTLSVILGVLLILGGISMLGTPLLTYMSAGYFIIILFFILGIVGIVRGIQEKRYGAGFFLAILSLILGIVGLFVPGAADMQNYILLYMAAGWFMVHGVMTIVDAISTSKQAGTGMTVLGVVLGVLEIIIGAYSVAHPAMMAIALGLLISFYFIESGISTISVSMATHRGGNGMTVVYVVLGILTILGGISVLATPLLTFLSAGQCIIMLFFISGVIGIVRGFLEKRYDKRFFFAIISLILGIVGFAVPGIADLNNSILLYMAAAWFLIEGVLTILTAIESKKEHGSTALMILGIVLGVLELIFAVYSIAHPVLLAVSLGLLVGFYLIESGINMIYIGSEVSHAVALSRDY